MQVEGTLLAAMILSKSFLKMQLLSKDKTSPERVDLSSAETVATPGPLPSPSIINVSSVEAVKGSLSVNPTAFAASRVGVLGLTRGLAAECSYMMSINRITKPIRVNSIVTGYIDGGLFSGLFQRSSFLNFLESTGTLISAGLPYQSGSECSLTAYTYR